MRKNLENNYSKEIKLIKNYKNKNKKNKYKKNIIISVIGHVDNGKTSILEYICKKVIFIKKEITQNINIYDLNLKNIKLYFLDTPGHDEMSILKDNVVRLSDIIILILSVERKLSEKDLLEIETIKSTNKPIIINFNKLDLIDNKIKEIFDQLINKKIIYKKYFSNIFFNKTSIKNKFGFKNLIKIIIKISKIYKKLINKNDFESYVLENYLDNNLGVVTTILIKNGILKIGDKFNYGDELIKIKSILDINNNRLKNSKNENIIKIIGFKNPIKLGFKIKKDEEVIKEKQEIKEIIIPKLKVNKNITNKNKIDFIYKFSELKYLNLLIKSETSNILDCIKEMLEKLNTEKLNVKFINITVGNINLSDIKIASATGAHVIGFNLKFKKNIIKIAEKYNVKLISFNNIYEIVEHVKKLLKEKEILKVKPMKENILKINKIFKLSDKKTIIGCFVLKGVIRKNSNIKIFRNQKLIFEGVIDSLKYLKDDVKEVKENFNCGIYIRNFSNYLIGDIIKTYE